MNVINEDLNAEKLEEARRRMNKSIEMRQALSNVKLTNSAAKDIELALASLSEADRLDHRKVCAKIVDMNYDKFVGNNNSEKGFEYQMARKGFSTTGDIVARIFQYKRDHKMA